MLNVNKNVGGGFQTRVDNSVKMLKDMNLLKLEERFKEQKERQFKVLQSKIMQLEKFDLGLSSHNSDTQSIVWLIVNLL